MSHPLFDGRIEIEDLAVIEGVAWSVFDVVLARDGRWAVVLIGPGGKTQRLTMGEFEAVKV